MAKETTATSKKIKISEAEQHVILAVLGATVVLGASAALISHFVNQISFNSKVIAEEEASIANYSDVIKNTGVCKAPSGSVYSDSELENCDPDAIEVSEIPGTLRADILENLAANESLNSVPKEGDSSCINPSTNKDYTYSELQKVYKSARGSEELTKATNLIKTCSALRVIPDALPAFKNEEALLASLNKLFLAAGWEPESLNPTGDTEVSEINPNLNIMTVNLSIEASTNTTMKVLNNVERSIREFDITNATIEWGSDDTLILNAQANAYYVNPSTITESSQTINPGGK